MNDPAVVNSDAIKKWEARNAIKGLNKDDAMREYIRFAGDLQKVYKFEEGQPHILSKTHPGDQTVAPHETRR